MTWTPEQYWEPQELRDMLQQCRDWLYAAYHTGDSLTADRVRTALPNLDKAIAALAASQVEAPAAQPQTPLGPCTQAEIDAWETEKDSKTGKLLLMWMDRAIKAEEALAVPPQRMWSAPAEFVMWALMEGAWQGDDVDGGASQDKAVELGLIVATEYDPKKHGETAYCEPGDQWFVPSKALLAALSGKPAPPQCAREADLADLLKAVRPYIACHVETSPSGTFADLLQRIDAALSGKPGAEQVRLQARRKGGEWLDIYPAQLEGMSAIGHELRAISGNAEAFLPTLDEYRNNLVEQCVNAARDGFEAAMERYVVIGPSGMAMMMINSIKALAVTRPERECIEKPRPADCPNVMSCGWHHVKTEPEIGLYVCSAPNCPHMIQAASVSRPDSEGG